MAAIKNHRYEDAAWVPSPNKSGKIVPKFIVQHYTAGYTAESAINTLTRKGSGVSAHVTIDLNGDITQHVAFNVKAWHAGPSSYMGYTGLNNFSIGIEIVNIGWLRKIGVDKFQDSYGNSRDLDYFPHGIVAAENPRVGSGMFYWPRYTAEQLHAVNTLTEALVEKYNIIDIVSHEEIDTRGWKVDPGPAFPMKLVKRHLDSDRGDDSEMFEVISSSLNVRGGPGSKYKVLGKLDGGHKTEIIERSGSWGRIDKDGWVHTGYLRRI
jgi:N-acetylmuramoyl-L-alanine amidase